MRLFAVTSHPVVTVSLATGKSGQRDCATTDDVLQKVQEGLQLKAEDDVGMHDYALDQHNGSVIHDERFTSQVYTPRGQKVSTGWLHSIDTFIGRLRSRLFLADSLPNHS